MAQATDIYLRMTRKKGATRKEIVAAFIEEVDQRVAPPPITR
jgi:hypothetical protein